MRTFVEESSIGRDGSVQERFLVGVAPWLRRQGCDVWTVPILFGMRRPYRELWTALQNNGEAFLNPDEHYRLTDFLYTVFVALRQTLMPTGHVQLGDLDVTSIFKEDRERFSFDRGSLDAILLSRLPRRLKLAGWRIDRLVQGYENMILEKGVILGFRRHMPETKIIGFQHCVVPPMLLCHFVTSEESRIAPLPNRIVCNGRLFRDALIAEGLDADRVVEGPALRYAHLWDDDERHTVGEPCVLIALPLEQRAAVELLHKTHSALQEEVDVPVKLKPHPLAHPPELLRAAGLHSLPTHFEFVEGGMAQWLARARVVVSAGSAVLFEAMVGGVPTVTVGRETALNLNPLSWLPDTEAVVYDPNDIRTEVRRLWELSEHERDAYRQRGRELRQDAFNPVTDERMDVFTDDHAPAPQPPSPGRSGTIQPKRPAQHLVDVR